MLYGGNKKLLIIDEFPCMCRNNESISSILQNLCDELLQDENVMIILCGSAMGFYDAVQFFPDYTNKKKSLCILYSEVEFILRYERRETPLYNSIIEAVALGNTKLNDVKAQNHLLKIRLKRVFI